MPAILPRKKKPATRAWCVPQATTNLCGDQPRSSTTLEWRKTIGTTNGGFGGLFMRGYL
jgi:hypothetical protein